MSPVNLVRFNMATQPTRPPQGQVELKVDPSTGLLAQLNADGSFDPLGGGSASAEFVAIDGTSATLSSAHNGKVLYTTSSDAVLITIPGTLASGFNCAVIQAGTGEASFSGSFGALNNAASIISGQYGAVSIVKLPTGLVVVSGAIE